MLTCCYINWYGIKWIPHNTLFQSYRFLRLSGMVHNMNMLYAYFIVSHTTYRKHVMPLQLHISWSGNMSNVSRGWTGTLHVSQWHRFSNLGLKKGKKLKEVKKANASYIWSHSATSSEKHAAYSDISVPLPTPCGYFTSSGIIGLCPFS